MALTEKSAHRKDVGKIADMQHQHFATIATIISRMARVKPSGWAVQNFAEVMASELASTNSKFDRERFLRACRPSDEEEAREQFARDMEQQ